MTAVAPIFFVLVTKLMYKLNAVYVSNCWKRINLKENINDTNVLLYSISHKDIVHTTSNNSVWWKYFTSTRRVTFYPVVVTFAYVVNIAFFMTDSLLHSNTNQILVPYCPQGTLQERLKPLYRERDQHLQQPQNPPLNISLETFSLPSLVRSVPYTFSLMVNLGCT